jgi:hypothetical protein
LINRDIFGLDPTDSGTLGFGKGNQSQQDQPKARGNLSKMGDGRSFDGGVPEEALALDPF